MRGLQVPLKSDAAIISGMRISRRIVTAPAEGSHYNMDGGLAGGCGQVWGEIDRIFHTTAAVFVSARRPTCQEREPRPSPD